jgi:hypothetical protein
LYLNPGFLADHAYSALRIAQIIREFDDSDRPTPAASTNKWLFHSHLVDFSYCEQLSPPSPRSINTAIHTLGIVVYKKERQLYVPRRARCARPPGN